MHLLKDMWSPMTNSIVPACNVSISALYRVSPSLVADVRRVLRGMCNDAALIGRPLFVHGLETYYASNHPGNRYPDTVRQRVAQELEMVLRADPSAEDKMVAFSVYDPEVNTHEKLRQLVSSNLSEVCEPFHPQTLQRMINDFLQSKGKSRISFAIWTTTPVRIVKHFSLQYWAFTTASS